jgi:hypothetical protein
MPDARPSRLAASHRARCCGVSTRYNDLRQAAQDGGRASVGTAGPICPHRPWHGAQGGGEGRPFWPGTRRQAADGQAGRAARDAPVDGGPAPGVPGLGARNSGLYAAWYVLAMTGMTCLCSTTVDPSVSLDGTYHGAIHPVFA